MKFMDLLFTRYASPFILLDSIIPNGRFVSFLETFEEQVEEQQMWEFYIHKLGAFDERTFDQFKRDVKGGSTKKVERPSDEQLGTTIKHSFTMLSEFNIEGGA